MTTNGASSCVHAEKPVPGMGSHVVDQLLLLWLEAAKVARLSLALGKSLWLQYYPWSRGMKLEVATPDGRSLSLLVVRSAGA